MSRKDSPSEFRQPGPASYPALILDLVKSRFLSIVAVVGIAGAAASYFGFSVSVPRRVRLLALTMLVIAPWGYVVGNYIISLLFRPNNIYLVDLDARYLDGALYRFPFSRFRDLAVTEGDICQLTPHLYTARDVNLEEMECRGTWRGTLDDRELLIALERIDELRGDLEDDAMKGLVLDTQIFSIVRGAVRETTLDVVRTFEHGTLPDDGSALRSRVDSALERHDLENRLRDQIESLEPDPAVAEQRPEDLASDGEADEFDEFDPAEPEDPQSEVSVDG